jgi:hypothetical protein
VEKSPPAKLETTIRGIINDLLEMPVTPHIRELRAKAVTYGRVINNWSVYVPTAPQMQAMLECVTELAEKVSDAKRDVSKVTRRPSPGSGGGGRQSSTAPPIPSIPPGIAWNASVSESSGIRTRKSSTPADARQTSRPPAATSVPAPPVTVPPSSAQRPVESATPVPALLRSRRSR